jgi:hypothetical protein
MRLQRLVVIDKGRHAIIKGKMAYEPCVWIGDDQMLYLRRYNGTFYRTTVKELAGMTAVPVGYMAQMMLNAIKHKDERREQPAQAPLTGWRRWWGYVSRMAVKLYAIMRHKAAEHEHA